MNDNYRRIETLLVSSYRTNSVYSIDCVFDLLYKRIMGLEAEKKYLCMGPLALCGIDIFSLTPSGARSFDMEYGYLNILEKFGQISLSEYGHRCADGGAVDPCELNGYLLWCDAFYLPGKEMFHYGKWHEDTLMSIGTYNRKQDQINYDVGANNFCIDRAEFYSILKANDKKPFLLTVGGFSRSAELSTLSRLWAIYSVKIPAALKAISVLRSYYPNWNNSVVDEGEQSLLHFKTVNIFTFMKNYVFKGLLLQLGINAYYKTDYFNLSIAVWEEMLSQWEELAVQAQWIARTKRQSASLETRWKAAVAELEDNFRLLARSLDGFVKGKD